MKKKQAEQKSGAPQLTLKAYFEEEQVTKNYHRYKTRLHEIRVTDTRVATFLRQIRATDKKSSEPRYTTDQQHLKMTEFIMTRAKVLDGVQKMYGDEWEASMRSLLKSVFRDEWHRDDDHSIPLADTVVIEATA